LSAFVVRLVDIQVVNASEHVKNSQDFATGTTVTLQGSRGDIVDTTGNVLADSTTRYDVQIDPALAVKGAPQRDADGNIVKNDD
ncbi:hypothetical protein ACC848_42540, partial [Rhizobium johnstonii]